MDLLVWKTHQDFQNNDTIFLKAPWGGLADVDAHNCVLFIFLIFLQTFVDNLYFAAQYSYIALA